MAVFSVYEENIQLSLAELHLVKYLINIRTVCDNKVYMYYCYNTVNLKHEHSGNITGFKQTLS